LAEFSELGVFRKKSISWMNGVRADSFGQLDDLPAVQKALHWPWTNQVGFVGFLDVNPGRISLRIDGSGGDIEFAAGADDPHGNLTAIGDQNFLKHVSLASYNSHPSLRANRRKRARKLA
jgi:hypothetical protein